VKKIIFAKQLPGGIWQWFYPHGTGADNETRSGDAEALAEHFEHKIPAQVVMVLPGQDVISQRQTVDESNKRHMAKLLPYEMEDNIVDPVDDLYFHFGMPQNDAVEVLYTREDNIQAAIEDLEAVGCDILKIIPDYLCMKAQENECVLVLDEGMLYARTSNLLGFAVEAEFAPLVMPSLASHLTDEHTVKIITSDTQQAKSIAALLPSEWLAEHKSDIQALQGTFWDAIDHEHLGAKLNLRSGKFARQLPFKQWIDVWKLPAIVAGVAFAVSAGSVVLANKQLKDESVDVRKQIQTVYQSVVPGGRSRDPIKALENMVSKTGNKNLPSNSMALINVVSSAMKSTPDIALTRMRYSGDKRELQVSVETPNFSDLESLRQAVVSAGFNAELLRVTTQGDLQRANVKISGDQS